MTCSTCEDGQQSFRDQGGKVMAVGEVRRMSFKERVDRGLKMIPCPSCRTPAPKMKLK